MTIKRCYEEEETSASAAPPLDQGPTPVAASNTEEATTSPVEALAPPSSEEHSTAVSTPLKTDESTDEPSWSPDSSVCSNTIHKKEGPSTPLTEAPSTGFFNDSDGEDSLQDDNNCHTRSILRIHAVLIQILQKITGVAVDYPRLTLILLSILSIGLCAAGYMTNFAIETDTHDLWPPRSSLSLDHAYWVFEDSHFGYDPVTVHVLVHQNGRNVLGQTGVERVFEVQTVFTELRGYKEGCAWAELFGDLYWVGQCSIDSVADFWNESYPVFEETVESDEEAIDYLSSTEYPNGVAVDVDTIIGNTQRDETTGLLTQADSFLILFNIPWSNVTRDFEAAALDRLLLLKEEWEERDYDYVLEIRSYSSYSDEYVRAIRNDLWLLPLAFAIVAIFTVTFAFGKCDKVKSRGLLGIGAVVTIVASVMTSFGILFLIGVPFTTQTIMVPFLMFGIGLDDAFIIYGSYNRKAHIKDVKERVRSTIADIGVSIFLTSLTSMLAFILGSFSQIPAVRWLCLYAFPCIGIDFLYQITFFIALIVVDERRIQQGRMDYCTCITVSGRKETEDEENNPADTDMEVSTPAVIEVEEESSEPHVADRLMGWWAKQVMKGPVQVVALLLFAGLFGGSVYCATQLEQEFDFVDLVPDDSYIRSYFGALDDYTTRNGDWSHAYFTGVNQSDPNIQIQMERYLEDLVATGKVDEPTYFWLWDFRKFVGEIPTNDTFHLYPFEWQINQFLKDDIYHELYDDDIGLTRAGKVTETRIPIYVNVDIKDTLGTTEMLKDMREVSAAQPINEGEEDWKFFTYTSQYHLYEFYNQVVKELIFTTIMGVVAVNVITICFIPHWTAVLFVFPFISILYVNMLGWLYVAGVQINAISYITLVMSIGLMVDYLMHILMRYYDCKGTRQERVQETLTSMGSSLFLGGTSTFLGILCLSLSTSDILQDVFIACVGLVVFGCLNGLVFLPVTLALVGPQ